MALQPLDEIHALQIQAGTLGRKAGHEFEDIIVENINSIKNPINVRKTKNHITVGDPAVSLLNYICSYYNKEIINSVSAISTGALATSEAGKKWLLFNDVKISRCKSDIILNINFSNLEKTISIGISTKQCNNKKPTNAQLYFTTALGFSNLLITNGINVSERAIIALRQFCGEFGYRPLDNDAAMIGRLSDPRRYFWEEICPVGRVEWEALFLEKQNEISKLLFQKAYLGDPFIPEFVLHKTKIASSWDETEVAIYGIDELIAHSQAYGTFYTKPYSVRKGSYKDPLGVKHQAPRFGIIQMQRGGQAQHPEQLQFNLEAGYFYKIGQYRTNMLGNSAG